MSINSTSFTKRRFSHRNTHTHTHMVFEREIMPSQAKEDKVEESKEDEAKEDKVEEAKEDKAKEEEAKDSESDVSSTSSTSSSSGEESEEEDTTMKCYEDSESEAEVEEDEETTTKKRKRSNDDDKEKTKKKRKTTFRGSQEIVWKGDFCVATNATEMMEMVEKHGVVICRQLISGEKCDKIFEKQKEDMKFLTKGALDLDDPQTYSVWDRFPTKHGMLLQHLGVGHAPFLFDVRQNNKISRVFSRLHGLPKEKAADMLCSTDGFSLHLPPELKPDDSEKKKKGSAGFLRGPQYLHTDHSLNSKNESYQSLVNIADDVKKGERICFQ